MKISNFFSIQYIIALSIGLVYLWFGALKFFPGLSPAEDLAKNTINALTFNAIPESISIIILAIWEVAVGILLITRLFVKQVVILGLIHMACTFAPLLLFPELSFAQPPFGYTLLGQYLFKNIIIVAAFLALYKLHKEK